MVYQVLRDKKGCVGIEADSMLEAQAKADSLPDGAFKWSEAENEVSCEDPGMEDLALEA